MIHPHKDNDHRFHEQSNGISPEVDSSENGASIVRTVRKNGVALDDAPQRSEGDEVDRSKLDQKDGDSDENEASEGQEKGKDPIRVYLKEMGMVPLLSRAGEVEIAKRIEKGKKCTSSARMGHLGFQAKRQWEPMLIGLV